MDSLNYHHLQYFWVVAQEGSIAAASRRLQVGRPAISMQLKSLEEAVGGSLFVRQGRSLELTPLGKTVFDYADVIFRAGSELMETVRRGGSERPVVLRVGIADVMPKLVTSQLLIPALQADDRVQLQCRADSPRRLFAALAVHELDLVLSDIPLIPGIDVRVFSHVLGSSTTSLFAEPALAATMEPGFPGSLDGQPFLMPSRESSCRNSLELWLEEHGARPKIKGEFDDSALLKVFGQAGCGIFPAPTVVAEQVCARYGVRILAELEGTRETFYAISPERRVKNGLVAQIVENAKGRLSQGV